MIAASFLKLEGEQRGGDLLGGALLFVVPEALNLGERRQGLFVGGGHTDKEISREQIVDIDFRALTQLMRYSMLFSKCLRKFAEGRQSFRTIDRHVDLHQEEVSIAASMISVARNDTGG
jgi:hypothetical protein